MRRFIIPVVAAAALAFATPAPAKAQVIVGYPGSGGVSMPYSGGDLFMGNGGLIELGLRLLSSSGSGGYGYYPGYPGGYYPIYNGGYYPTYYPAYPAGWGRYGYNPYTYPTYYPGWGGNNGNGKWKGGGKGGGKPKR